MKIDINTLPKKSGVYLWKDSLGNVLYVGKAKNLRTRMSQYFKGMLNSYKTAKLVENIEDYEYIITNSEKEALVLERNLIEKYHPEYNILLTDDKRYPYIKVKRNEKIEVSMVYRIAARKEKALYYGPFPVGYGARKLTNLIQRLTIYEKGLPSKRIDQKYWDDKFEYAKKLLNSNNNYLVKELSSSMNNYADNMQFEMAKEIKESLDAFKYMKETQVAELNLKGVVDVVGVSEKNGYLSVVMLFYRNGVLLSKKETILNIVNSPSDTMRQFMSQYYKININPSRIITNFKFESHIATIIPIKGNNKKILNIAIENSQDNLEAKLNKFMLKEKGKKLALNKLKEIVGLDKLYRIIMIDNSTTNNTLPTSGIISYVNGERQPREYRKYNLIKRDRLADVDYMNQSLTKYFSKDGYNIPDLLIVDGGKPQINEAKKVIPPNIKLVGLVKDDRHKTRALVLEDGTEIEIELTSLYNFLSKMQLEVDKYAKAFHHKKRKTTLEGKLTSIPGIGESTEKKLLEHFKTYSAIYNATTKDLTEVVSIKLAKKIKEAL